MKNVIRIIALVWCVTMSAASWSNDLDDGLAAYKANDYQTALQKLLPFAKRGNTDAEMLVSIIYHNQNNDAEATKWVTRAADRGSPLAQRSLSGKPI